MKLFLFAFLVFFLKLLQADDAAILEQLPKASLEEKLLLLDSLSPDSYNLLQHLLDSELYSIKKTKQVVVVEKDGKTFTAFDPFTQEQLGSFKSRKLKKIVINNKIRELLKQKLAIHSLTSGDEDEREKVIESFFGTQDQNLIAQIRALVSQEPSQKVKDAMQKLLFIDDLSSQNQQLQLQAIEALEGDLHPSVKIALEQIESDNPLVTKAVANSLEKIEQRTSINRSLENVFFGFSYGSVLVLVAVGLAITFGVMGVINMAHGELVMLGAYTAFVVQQWFPGLLEFLSFSPCLWRFVFLVYLVWRLNTA